MKTGMLFYLEHSTHSKCYQLFMIPCQGHANLAGARCILNINTADQCGLLRPSVSFLWFPVESDQSDYIGLIRSGHAQNMFGDIGQDKVGGDRGDLHQPRLAPFALHVIVTGETEAAMGLQAGLGRVPGRL